MQNNLEENQKTIEKIIDTLIEKKLISVDHQEYFSIEGLQLRYNEKSLDKRTLSQMSHDFNFPCPVQFSSKKILWVKDEVIEWENKQKEKRHS